MARIFICHRVAEDIHDGKATEIADSLRHWFGTSNVFKSNLLDTGDNWKDRLNSEITRTTVFLLVVGPQWNALLKQKENEKEDILRAEIDLALTRCKKRILIVAYGRAQIDPNLLPATIKNVSETTVVTLEDRATDLPTVVSGLSGSPWLRLRHRFRSKDPILLLFICMFALLAPWVGFEHFRDHPPLGLSEGEWGVLTQDDIDGLDAPLNLSRCTWESLNRVITSIGLELPPTLASLTALGEDRIAALLLAKGVAPPSASNWNLPTSERDTEGWVFLWNGGPGSRPDSIPVKDPLSRSFVLVRRPNSIPSGEQ